MMSSQALWIIGGLWVGCFIAEACEGFRTTRALIREVARQQRWLWSTAARPFKRALAFRETR